MSTDLERAHQAQAAAGALNRPAAEGMVNQLAADPYRLADVLHQSGFFPDVKSAASAIVKMLAGAELGFDPITSMTGVFVVEGRVMLGADLIARAVKRHPDYDYRVTDLSDQQCQIAFYRRGTPIGISTFTIQDAEAAKLVGRANWQRYPRNMLFARAVANGARWFCPEVLSGAPVVLEDEIETEPPPERAGELVDVIGDPEPAGTVDTPVEPIPDATSAPLPPSDPSVGLDAPIDTAGLPEAAVAPEQQPVDQAGVDRVIEVAHDHQLTRGEVRNALLTVTGREIDESRLDLLTAGEATVLCGYIADTFEQRVAGDDQIQF